MKPIIKITSKGKDLSESIGSRLISLSIRDEAGTRSDSLTLVLSDDPPLPFPSEAQVFEVAIGFGENVTHMGSFAVKHLALSGWPRALKIEALPLQKYPGLKSQREESWHDISLGEIVRRISERNGLSSAITKGLSSIRISHEDQIESDISFLTRLGRRFDAIVKVSSDYLIFSEESRATQVSGRELPRVVLTDITSFEYSSDQSPSYTGVRAFWYDVKTAKKNQILLGKEGAVLNLEYTKRSEEDARKAAEARLRSILRRGKTLSITALGNPEIAAERIGLIQGLREGLDGEWIIKSVEHLIDSAGYISKVQCETSGLDESET